jgi:hypothetical protein
MNTILQHTFRDTAITAIKTIAAMRQAALAHDLSTDDADDAINEIQHACLVALNEAEEGETA